MARRELPEINASSMADIAFLLLTFFLVATTLDKAEGIERIVPNPDDPAIKTPPIIHERNLLRILVNQFGQVQINGENSELFDIKKEVKDFVDNGGGVGEITHEVCTYCKGARSETKSTTPQDAIVSLELDNASPYNYFYTAENLIDQAYLELYEQYSKDKFGISYAQVQAAANKPNANPRDVEKLKEVESAYPKKIAKARLRSN